MAKETSDVSSSAATERCTDLILRIGMVCLGRWFLIFFTYRFIEHDYQFNPQYTQWYSFIENMKLTTLTV